MQEIEFNLWVEKILWRREWIPIPVFLPGEAPSTEEPLLGATVHGVASATQLTTKTYHLNKKLRFHMLQSSSYAWGPQLGAHQPQPESSCAAAEDPQRSRGPTHQVPQLRRAINKHFFENLMKQWLFFLSTAFLERQQQFPAEPCPVAVCKLQCLKGSRLVITYAFTSCKEERTFHLKFNPIN